MLNMLKLSKLPIVGFLARLVSKRSPRGATRGRRKPRIVSPGEHEEELPELAGKVSVRASAILRRAYHMGWLTKPVGECTDEELLFIRGIGKKTLAEIRRASKRKGI